MFTSDWAKRKTSYDFVVVGSGYGGSITAARIAAADLNPKPSICILERGKERWPGNKRFPDTLDEVTDEFRSGGNPHGLYELLNYRDISVVKGCGLGGTSLINANVAATPDPEVFEQPGWPAALRWGYLRPLYDKARSTLGAGPDPRAWEFPKVQAMDRRARQIGLRAVPLDLAINFTMSDVNEHGVPRRPCLACGDCTTGCNHLAKSTLYMNYLPMARNAGARIFTETEVEWIERRPDGAWRVHGANSGEDGGRFKLDAANVILAAGSINSTEILMRSEMHGLSLSPAVGSRFSCNGDFFGLAYNGDLRTQVTGFGNHTDSPAAEYPPGPAIVSAIHYNGTRAATDRFQIEDLTIPTAYIAAARRAFPMLQREDTDSGDEAEERRRIQRDIDLTVAYDPDGALNHTMFYLVMAFDDARGRMVFETPWHERDGRLRVVWDEAGRQRIYKRLDEELRRHSRVLGASYIANPLWSFMEIRHLLTAHPIGGCPIGEDPAAGAVDEFGRLFRGDGGVHEGLFVADGSVIPTSIGVNPFLTISALAEHIAERKIRQLKGDPYPQPRQVVAVPVLDPSEVTGMEEPELERLFRNRPPGEIDKIVNTGRHEIDVQAGKITNDTCWKGFFPKGHVLNAMSAMLFTGFRKEFRKENGKYMGVTSDSDGRIRARNSVEEVVVERGEGDLEPGRYLLLRYLDAPWQGYYDLLRVVQDNLIIGRVYLGVYPHGARLFTFAMTREYRLAQMTTRDHRELFARSAAPSKEDLGGAWRMDVISNANQLQALAFLDFQLKPDGRLESRYQLAGLLEGLVAPSFLKDHFELRDFTPFHDEIRKLNDNLLVGKYVTELPEGLAPLGPAGSLGLLHFEEGRRFGFYYLLTRVAERRAPTNTLLRPFLDVHLPDGLGMTFDEEMEGWYAAGQAEATSDKPANAVNCGFRLRMTVRDLNEFIEAPAHEARAQGSIRFGDLDGRGPVTCSVDERRSWFQYLNVSQVTGEAELKYYLEFATDTGRRFALDGRKYMQKDKPAGVDAAREVIDDYTTLYGHLYEIQSDERRRAGAVYLKFRTFEDLAAAGNLLDFLRSFQVTGTDDPLLRTQGLLRFLAFTAQFVQHEYDPLAPAVGALRDDVRAEVLRGAETPDYFSTRPTVELQSILRSTSTQPIESLLNTGEVRVDFEKRRIFRDSFWKGSFAKDTLLGWEERVRTASLGGDAKKLGSIYAGGSFWKRFDRIDNGRAYGQVVNYDLAFLPGDPEVLQIPYPNDSRGYFRSGDPILLLQYRNHPYRIVYDTIKVIDDNSAIGVMHLGSFPDGMEFATFVMERHNYPFQNMSVEDHRLAFADPRCRVPSAAELEGRWEGNLILLRRPSVSLLNQANPMLFRLRFIQAGAEGEARCQFEFYPGRGGVETTPEGVRLFDSSALEGEMRMSGNDMLIGRWTGPEFHPLLMRELESYLEPDGNHFVFHYVLQRV